MRKILYGLMGMMNISRGKTLSSFLLIFCFLISSPLLAKEKTSSEVLVIFLEKSRSSLPDPYVKKLEKVLLKDLSYLGDFSLKPLSFSKKQKAKYLKEKKPFLEARFSGKTLFLSGFSKNRKVLEKFTPIAFSERLSKDRKTLHSYVHVLGKKLFSIDSILDKTLLYTNRIKKEGKWSAEVCLSDYDGENVQTLKGLFSYCTHPILLSSKELLFVSYELGLPKIFCYNIQTKMKKPFLSLKGSQVLPALSKDKKSLSFVSDAAGRPDLFLYSLKNREIHQLFTKAGSTQASSSFSPDGKNIAFVSDQEGSPKIYSLTLPKTKRFFLPEILLLTKKNRSSSSPSWSPDGKKLIYSAKTGKIRQIWMYDFATKLETQITFEKKHMENPKWTSDNRYVICNSDMENFAEIYLINVYNKSLRKISKGVGFKKFPTLTSTRVQL